MPCVESGVSCPGLVIDRYEMHVNDSSHSKTEARHGGAKSYGSEIFKEQQPPEEEIYEENLFGEMWDDGLGRMHGGDAFGDAQRDKLLRRHAAGDIFLGDNTPCQSRNHLRYCSCG